MQSTFTEAHEKYMPRHDKSGRTFKKKRLKRKDDNGSRKPVSFQSYQFIETTPTVSNSQHTINFDAVQTSKASLNVNTLSNGINQHLLLKK
jgi:hypothetical protein